MVDKEHLLERLMEELFPEETRRKNEGQCPFCGKQINPEKEFHDDLSRREFEISGMCQKCQDDFFTEELDDD